MEKQNLLISACLLGCNTRYDGGNNRIDGLSELRERYNLIPVCPEQLGGLPTPRIPSERRGEKVVGKDGSNVTEEFFRGARETVSVARLFEARIALLKEKSPSCGSGRIYDGTFEGRLTEGYGVAAQLLMENGIRVIGEKHLDELLK